MSFQFHITLFNVECGRRTIILDASLTIFLFFFSFAINRETMDFSDTCIFSTNNDLSDCQLKTVLRIRPVTPEFSLALSNYNSDKDSDYEPASEDSNDEDCLEFDSDASLNSTTDDGSTSECEDSGEKDNQKRKAKRMKMGTQDNSPTSNKDLNSIWVVQAAEVNYNSWKGERVVKEKIVGSFSLKSDAIKNAKFAISSLPMCGDLFDEDGYMKNADETEWAWSVMEDSSNSVGEKGGVIFKVEGDEGDGGYASITKVTLDRPITEENEVESRSESDEDEHCNLQSMNTTEDKPAVSKEMKSDPIKEVWLVEETKYDFYKYDIDAHVKRLIGLFSTKAGAMDDAKKAFTSDYKGFCYVTGEAPIPLFGSDGKMKKVEETGWKDAGRLMGQPATTMDNTANIGESGGYLYRVEYHRYMYEVSIRKVALDRYVASDKAVWLVQEAQKDCLESDPNFYEQENKLIGFFFDKPTAMKIAKDVFTKNFKVTTAAMKEKNLNWRDEENRKAMKALLKNRPTTKTDNSAKVEESGGLLYKVSLHQAFMYEVSIEKTFLDTTIKKAIQIC